MKKILAIVLVLVVAIAALVPYLTGSEVENQFRAGIDNMNKRGDFDFAIESYDRGWMSSHAKVSVGGLGDERATFNNEITHPWVPGLGQTHIVSTLSRDADPDLSSIFSEPPLRIETWVTDDENFRVELRSPVAQGTSEDANGVQTYVEWNGLSGFYERADLDETFELVAPGVRISDSQGGVAVNELRLVGDSRMDDRYEQTVLRSMLGSGQAKITIGKFSFNAPSGESVSFAADFDATADYRDERGDFRSKLAISDVELDRPGVAQRDQVDIKGGTVEFNLNKMRVDALARTLTTLDKIGNTPMQQVPERQRMAFLDDVASIFDTDSEIELDVSSLETSRGNAGMGVTLSLGEPLSERAREYMPLPARVMQRMQVSAAAFADRSLLAYGVEQSSNPNQVARMIDQWENNNLVTVNNARYSMVLDYKDNSLALNGNTLPPQVMQALTAQMGALGQ